MSLPNDPFGRMAALLQMESQAQARQTLERVRRLTAAEAERGGDCLLGLVARDESAGLGGRFVLTLAKRGGAPLPWTRLQPGSPVLLSLQGRAHDAGRRGVVCERDECQLRVGLLPAEWVTFAHFQISGSMQVSTLSRRYSSSCKPYARLWRTRILLFSPSTKPRATLLSGAQYAAIPSQWLSIIRANFS
jgi:hypothetical protein